MKDARMVELLGKQMAAQSDFPLGKKMAEKKASMTAVKLDASSVVLKVDHWGETLAETTVAKRAEWMAVKLADTWAETMAAKMGDWKVAQLEMTMAAKMVDR